MPDVIYFGGLARAGNMTADAAAPESKYLRVDWPFPEPRELDLDSLSPEDFDVEMKQWLATVWVPRNAVPRDDRLAEFDLRSLEDEFRSEYAAGAWREMERGVSAEEWWISQQLFHGEPLIWLINREQPQQSLDRVSRKRFFNGVDLVWLLGAICIEWRVDEPSVPVGTFDGKTGHSISIAGLNPFEFPHPAGGIARRGWFSFHDPWPARSLLAAGCNRAGVTAVEDYPREPLWLISPTDLSRVIYGSLVPLEVWVELSELEQTARFIEADHKSSQGMFPSPPWGDDNQPFADLIAFAGDVTGAEAICALGHGKLELRKGDSERAEGWFGMAMGLGGPAFGREAAACFDEHGDRERAQQWFARAGEAGDGTAAARLGSMLLEEDESDPMDEALRWFTLAAEYGQDRAAGLVGSLLVRRGRFSESRPWYEQAAEAGDMLSAARLGMLLAELGEDREARFWLERSFDAGEVEGAPMFAILLADIGERSRARAVLEWAREQGESVSELMSELAL